MAEVLLTGPACLWPHDGTAQDIYNAVWCHNRWPANGPQHIDCIDDNAPSITATITACYDWMMQTLQYIQNQASRPFAPLRAKSDMSNQNVCQIANVFLQKQSIARLPVRKKKKIVLGEIKRKKKKASKTNAISIHPKENVP